MDGVGVVACGRVDGFCSLVGLLGTGLGTGLGAALEDDEVEVELEVELEDEVEVEDEDEDEDEELELELLKLDPVPCALDEALVVVLDELEPVGMQLSVSEAIAPNTGGRFRLEIGVPGATFGTVKV